MAELSPEEFRRNLFQAFRSRGVLEALKTQLRNRLIAELQETTGKPGLVQKSQSMVTDNLYELAANSLIADHLKRCKYEYSLSVFLPESGLQESKLLTIRDVLLILKISTGSQLYKHLEILIDRNRTSSKGFLMELLTQLAALHSCEKSSKAVQTSLQGQSSVEDKLQSVENQYTRNLQTENKSWSSQMEERLLEINRQWEQKKKKMLDEELEYLKATEIARLRIEEKEQYQREVQKIKQQFEQEFAAKSKKLKEGQREKLQLLGDQKQIQDEEAYSQRQKILEGILSLKERESEFDLNQKMKIKSLQLEEERIKVLSEEVKRKKSLLEEAETNYHVRLEQEVKRYKQECEEEMLERRQNLERKEKQLQRDKDMFEGQKDTYMNASNELHRTKGKLHELQLELENYKLKLASSLQQKESTVERLTEDYKALKEREVDLSKENAALRRDLLKYQDEQKGNQKIIKELTEKSVESTADLQHLREELKQMDKNNKSKEKAWKDVKKKLESKLDDACQKSHNYQHLYEELLASHSARSQEVAELKLSLQQTQQVLDMELGRRRATSVPHTDTLPSDVESPLEIIQTIPKERQRLATDTDSNMDETSSTMVMIAQSKALFDRLETEAKELEESYQRFQSRISQMELDVYPTRTLEIQAVAQTLS
ncbi:centriole and centriolar satellite protein OFD1-like isoform X2 [Montipora capricornis]|uniref:centriole and centriolar satellite protein OFD1-like isoform X2 n=2 Tax=Montipora capricornis TaxID=246305 RepID=UPI0035F1FFFE